MQSKIQATLTTAPDNLLAEDSLFSSLMQLLDLDALVPTYSYWSPLEPLLDQANPAQFADGGSLENTGVASMLSYSDIRNIIAFINVETPLRRDKNNIVVVDDCLPPLFGYQPYQEGIGYVRYSLASPASEPVYQYNKVFEHSEFQVLLDGLWNASNNATTATIFSQTQLTTVPNPWFNVVGGTTVTVTWAYLNYATNWYESISDPLVRGLVDYEYVVHTFPNYNTLMTDLSARQINLLSNFTSWMVQDPANSEAFTNLYIQTS